MTAHAVRFRSAREALEDLLADGKPHTWSECADRAGIRFGARIEEIRRAGSVIETSDLETGKSYKLVLSERCEPRERRRRVLLTPRDLEMLRDGYVSVEARREAERALKAGRG